MRNHVQSLKKTKAYKELPKRQRDFVQHYLKIGDAKEAYRKAGYKTTARTWARQARHLLLQMQPYITEQLQEYVSGTEMAILGTRVLRELAETAESEQVKLNAAKEIMTRTFPEKPREVHHHHTSDAKKLSDTELMERLQSLQEKMFLEAEVINVDNTSGRDAASDGRVGEKAEVQRLEVLQPLSMAEDATEGLEGE